MKRIICLFIVILFILSTSFSVYCSIISLTVARLIPAQAMAGSAGSTTIPALIKATTSGGGTVSSWLPLLVPASAVGQIAGAILALGAGLAIDYLFLKGGEYLQNKGIDKDLFQTKNVYVPDGHTAADYTVTNGTILNKGIFESSNAASDACIAMRATLCGSTMGFTAAAQSPLGLAFFYVSDACGSSSTYGKTFRYFVPSTSGGHYETEQRKLTPQDVQSQLTADLTVGNTDAPALRDAVLDQAAQALEQPTHQINLNAAIKAAMANALAKSLTQTQKDTLETDATVPVTKPIADVPNTNALTPAQVATSVQLALSNQKLSSEQIAAAIALAQGKNLTQVQIQAAVKGAIDDKTNVDTPLDQALILPAKLSLTTVLTSFMASINSLPIIETLRGITVHCSGSSSLCVQLPQKYGGSTCYDASGLTDSFNMIGSALLSMTTIMGFIWLFKG